MPRFFTSQIDGRKGFITGEDARHIAKSLRMKVGEDITLCDTKGVDFFGTISCITDNSVEVIITHSAPTQSEPSLRVHLFQALPKGDKMDAIVQKAVELGVWAITPVLTRFCVSRPDEKSLMKKVDRWQKIALEAAKQSGRGIVPQVHPAVNFAGYLQWVGEHSAHTHLLAYEGGGVSLKAVALPEEGEVTLLVGSEGGFSGEEAAQATETGVQSITLGKRILRCETAPVALLSVLMYKSGNLE